MIPKKIHYCWFGGGKKSELIERCIDSWKKYCPDCEIIEWNESNYDITKNQYMYQAYKAKRWGFVPDYARLDIIYNHGGIYLDTDVELIKNIDKLFELDGFMGFEQNMDANGFFPVNTGQGFGAKPGNDLIKQMRDLYNDLSFYEDDGKLNLQPSPYYNTLVLKKNGLVPDNTKQTVADITVFSSEYMCPINWKNQKCIKTENTFSIHHFNGSWLSDEEKKKRKQERTVDFIVHIPNMIMKKILGANRYEQLKNRVKLIGRKKK